MGVGFETTTGPSGPSRSRETWHVLFSFTNERGEICDLTSNRVPHVFLKGFFLEPPKKKIMSQKISNDGVFGVKKKNTDHLFWGSKNFTSGTQPWINKGSTKRTKSLKEETYTPTAFYSKTLSAKKQHLPKRKRESRLPFASNFFRGYVKNFGGVRSPNKTPGFFSQWRGGRSPWTIP